MSEKQDRIAPRTATDLERKYNFGKTFADMLGLIDDSRDKVDEVESNLRNEITQTSTSLSRTAESIGILATSVAESISSANESITELSKKVEMQIDAEAVKITVEERLSEGVDKVITESGYTFDSDGLTISKEGEAMSNLLNNTGMYVKRGEDEILTANIEGVKATDLHAQTYLIIGEGNGRCRFEDYSTGLDKRIGCFWLGE